MTSVIAARAADWSAEACPAAHAAMSDWMHRVVDGAGQAAAGVVDQGDRVVGEQGVAAAAGEGEVVADVAGCLIAGHPVDVGAQADALVQGGQDAEPEPGAQGGLADEQGGEAGDRVRGRSW